MVGWTGARAQDGDAASAAAPGPIPWERNADQAVEKAQQSQQHIIAEIFTDWCPWCRKLEDSTLTHPLVQAMADSFIFLRSNAELDTSLAAQFKIKSYPTVLLLEGNGNEVGRITGYVPPEEFVARITQYLNGEGTFWTLQKQNRDRPSDPETIFRLAQKHMERGQYNEARSLFERGIGLDRANNTGLADDAQFAMGMMYRREKQWFKAIEEFRAFTEAFPDSDLREDAELYIPWLNARAGDREEALEGYRYFLDKHSGSSEADWVRAQIAKLEEGQEPSEQESGSSPVEE